MNYLKIALISLAIITLGGCATGAKLENMTYTDSSYFEKTFDSELKNDVQVSQVTGGEKTNPAWTSEISNDAFKGALKNSLKSQGLYSESGKYALSAQLIRVDQPLFGLDFTVTTNINYKLIDTTSNQVLINETIIAPYTATVGDAFIAIERLRLANEGSGKENIKFLMKKLNDLNISPNAIAIK